MKIKTLSITDHALERWQQRGVGPVHVDNITNFVKKSTIIRGRILPYNTPRLDNITYSVLDHFLFILQPTSLHQYRLLTIITEEEEKITPYIESNQIEIYDNCENKYEERLTLRISKLEKQVKILTDEIIKIKIIG